MVMLSNKAAILGLALSGSASTSHVTTMAFQSSLTTTTKSSTSSTSLNNMLRDYADYSSPRGPYSDSGAQSTNWRKNQGYTSSSTPRLFGGSYRDAETNPYYDPGWAQSTRRDNPAANFDSGSNYNGYDDPYNRENRGYWNAVTYPGVGDSYRSNKVYTNPTNPYYDPIWSQSYDHQMNYEPIREEEHRMYYGAGYDRDYYSMYPDYGMGGGGQGGGGTMGRRGGGGSGMGNPEYQGGYRGGRGDAFGGYGRMNGPGRGLLATKQQQQGVVDSKKKWMEARTAGYKGINGNSLMRIGRQSESKSMALRMSYPIYDEFDGPFLPPGMGGPGMMGGPGARMMEGRWGPDMRRNGRGGGRGGNRRGPGGPMGPDGMGMGRDGMGPNGPMGGEMGGRGMGGGPSMGGPPGWGPGGPQQGGQGGFGRDKAVGRMSLKDMAARTTQSYDAEVISSMNNRNNNNNNQLPGDSMGPMMNQQQRAGGGPTGPNSDPTSTAQQYVPLSSTYGPQATERSPPLSVGAPPPEPVIETRASPDVASETSSSSSSSSSTPSTVQTARGVRPSVVLVTSTGVRNENSQGSGFVVEFDDADDNTDIEEVDRCFILTSAHVAPPGWKVSVTFPSDPAKQYPATVVGRKLNSDLALLAVECSIDDNDEDPFPPPLVMSSEDILTDTKSSSKASNEIGSPLYAFGYPMGLEGPTMTSGILSATTKGINYMDAPTGEEPSEISKSRPFEKTSFVITDAAMAGGMSGGPLVNGEGVVLGVNALVRPDLRALGNYAVSSIECESFLEKLEEQRENEAERASRKEDTRRERRKKRKEARSKSVEDTSSSSSPPVEEDDGVPVEGVAGYRVMLYGYSSSKAEATTALRRAAGLDELRAENAMRSAYSFGAGVVDEFYVSEVGDRKRAERAAKKKAEELLEKLKEEGMMVEVEPLTLLP